MEDESVEDADQSQTEDSSAGMCNGSLGRAILHTVQRNEAEMQQQQQQQQQQQHMGKKVSSGKKSISQRVILYYLHFRYTTPNRIIIIVRIAQ